MLGTQYVCVYSKLLLRSQLVSCNNPPRRSIVTKFFSTLAEQRQSPQNPCLRRLVWLHRCIFDICSRLCTGRLGGAGERQPTAEYRNQQIFRLLGLDATLPKRVNVLIYSCKVPCRSGEEENRPAIEIYI